MKNNIRKVSLILIFAISLTLLIAACGRPQPVNESMKTSSTTVNSVDSPAEKGLLGAAAANQDKNLEIADMLRYALEDEYLARDTYTKIMAKFGEIRPFVNIRESENNHIAMLLPLFETYGLSLPEHESDQAPYGGTLQEAYIAGVQAEIENIAMYERFLKEDLPEDVRNIFEKLLRASEKHLKAFERKAD